MWNDEAFFVALDFALCKVFVLCTPEAYVRFLNTECFKKSFKMVFQMLLCSKCYKNVFT
jgi:hypothetical protein